MENIFESQTILIDTIKKLINKTKTLKVEVKNLQEKIASLTEDNQKSVNATILTAEQKAQIEQLLQETKEVLMES